MDMEISEQEQWRALDVAWRIPFAGPHVSILRDRIVRANKQRLGKHDFDNPNPDSLPRNCIPIVQSSGTGKSRTVYELGREMWSIPLNIRIRGYGGGYPAPDDGLRNLVMGASQTFGPPAGMRLALVFAALLDAVADEVMQCGIETPLDLQRHLESAFTSTRGAGPSVTRREALYNEVYQRVLGGREGYLDKNIYDLRQAAYKFASAVGATVEKPFLLAIDECAELFADNKAFEGFCQLHYAYIGEESSQRLFVELPFDVSSDAIIKEDERTLANVCTVEFLARFGRPLWRTMRKSLISNPSTSESAVDDHLNWFAQAKLLCSTAERPWDSADNLAVLSTCLALDFEPGRLSAVETDQITSHMRVLYSVPQHGRRVTSGSSSEPLLAEAAARMHAYWGLRSADILARTMDTPGARIANGGHGVLAARLLCILAQQRSEPSGSGALHYTRPIPVLDFLKALFQDKWLDAVRNARPTGAPDGVPAETLADAFADAFVSFTHWAPADDARVLRATHLWAAAARSMALWCVAPHGVRGADLVVPVVFGRDAPLGRRNVSALVVQVRNGGACARLPDGFSRLVFGSGAQAVPPRPFIFLTMQLAAQPAAQVPASAAPAPPRAQKPGRAPRYDVVAVGCSRAVYRVVGEGMADAWARLLAPRTLAGEHPCRDDAALAGLRGLKPEWVQASFEGWAAARIEDGPGAAGREGEAGEWVVAGERALDSIQEDEVPEYD